MLYVFVFSNVGDLYFFSKTHESSFLFESMFKTFIFMFSLNQQIEINVVYVYLIVKVRRSQNSIDQNGAI